MLSGHHPPHAGQRLSAGFGNQLIRFRPLSVQAEQVRYAHKRVVVVLLNKALPIQTEHADLPVGDGVLAAKGDGTIREMRLHAVPADLDGEHGPLGVLRPQLVIVEVLP